MEPRKRRHKRIRSKIYGTNKCPRLSVFKSNRNMFAQLIDDNKAETLVSASIKEIGEKSLSKMNKTAAAKELGKIIAHKALENKIKKVVFDRGGYRYHGRVKALAEGAREGGLKF